MDWHCVSEQLRPKNVKVYKIDSKIVSEDVDSECCTYVCFHDYNLITTDRDSKSKNSSQK